MAVATGTAAALAAAATVTTGAIGAATKDSPDSGRLKFQPGQELDFIRNAQSIIDEANRGIKQTYDLEKAYNKRMDVVDGIIKGTIPGPQALKDLTSAANDIAMAFGTPEEAKARGYLTENDYNDLQNLRAMESESFTDPTLENELKTERAALEQDLARKGVSPAQRLQALNQFNKLADERRFTRNEELKTGTTNRTLARIDTGNTLRQTTFGNIQTQINNALTGAGALATSAAQRNTVGQTAIEGRRVLGQQKSDTFATVGKTELSSGQGNGQPATTPAQFVGDRGATYVGQQMPNPNYVPNNPTATPILKDSSIKQSGVNKSALKKLNNGTRI